MKSMHYRSKKTFIKALFRQDPEFVEQFISELYEHEDQSFDFDQYNLKEVIQVLNHSPLDYLEEILKITIEITEESEIECECHEVEIEEENEPLQEEGDILDFLISDIDSAPDQDFESLFEDEEDDLEEE